MGIVVAFGLVAGGCGDGDEEAKGPTATVAKASTPVATITTTTTFAGDPYAIPEVIDVAYVNRVLSGLDQAYGDLFRLIVANRSLPPEIGAKLQSIYLDQASMQLELDLLQDALRGGLQGVKAPPGNERTTTIELLTVRPRCLFLEVNSDNSDVAEQPNPVLSHQWIALIPVPPERNSLNYNQTGWGYLYKGFQKNLFAPPDPCANR